MAWKELPPWKGMRMRMLLLLVLSPLSFQPWVGPGPNSVGHVYDGDDGSEPPPLSFFRQGPNSVAHVYDDDGGGGSEPPPRFP